MRQTKKKGKSGDKGYFRGTQKSKPESRIKAEEHGGLVSHSSVNMSINLKMSLIIMQTITSGHNAQFKITQ